MLSVLFLVAVINFTLVFFYVVLESSYRRISLILANRHPPFCLDTYSLSISYFRCKSLCIVIVFVVLWSICLSSSLVHFKNVPEYLSRGARKCLSLLMRFLLQSLVSKVSLFVWGTFLKRFLSLLIWWCPLPIFPSTCKFPFLRTNWFFLDLAVLFLPLFGFFYFPLFE